MPNEEITVASSHILHVKRYPTYALRIEFIRQVGKGVLYTGVRAREFSPLFPFLFFLHPPLGRFIQAFKAFHS